jgi:hypothetical protein
MSGTLIVMLTIFLSYLRVGKVIPPADPVVSKH